jgi:hypothetical protein
MEGLEMADQGMKPEDIPQDVWDDADNALAALHFSSDPLEQVTACARAILAERARLEPALRRSMIALDDWLNIYASDHCDEARVKEAQERVMQFGTIGYIADVQEQNCAAIRKGET